MYVCVCVYVLCVGMCVLAYLCGHVDDTGI